jgi:ArsR family transcriptional regulator
MPLASTVETMNILGDESRLRICALLRERELSVSDLVRVTGLSQSRVSTHLARLRQGGFVRDRRDGQHAFYALAGDALSMTAKAVLDDANGADDPTLDGDKRRLVELDAERRGSLPESFAGEMDRHYSPGRTWQSLAAGLAALLELGDVLDAGSGDGAVAGYLAPFCRSLTCVDTSARMIEAAKARLEKYPHARAQQADCHDLPFRAGSFDAVLLFHTLTYADDPKRVAAECARVLRPGGRLVVQSLDQHAHRALTAAYGERHAGFSPRALRTMLTQAGLAVSSSAVACREAKKPHFQTIVSIAQKRKSRSSKNAESG